MGDAIRILGIDPGSRITGWGVLICESGRVEPLEWGSVKPPPTDDFAIRLLAIKQGILEVVRRLRPDQVAIEDLFHARNVRTAIQMGQVRGVVVAALAEEGLPVLAYAPRLVKKAVSGYGGAGKPQVGRMVKSLLGLPRIPTPPDAADALAVALCHAHSTGMGTASGGKAGTAGIKHPAKG
jgi:crossover junction endodeoxyribonuclease RuvC